MSVRYPVCGIHFLRALHYFFPSLVFHFDDFSSSSEC